MKAFDVTGLQVMIDEDFTWRKREISDLLGIAQTGTVNERRTARRASIPIMYAHWEGFTKNSFLRYFEFVAFRRKKFSDLTANFLYLASKAEIGTIIKSPQYLAIEKFEAVFVREAKANKDPMRKHVNTRDNLRWAVLKELFTISGITMPNIDYGNLIDIELCDKRNAIAHGESADPSLEQITKLRKELLDLMNTVKNCIITAAANEEYLKKPA